MSANDIVIIRKVGRKYEIYHHGCVDNDFVPDGKPDEIATSLKKAIEIANSYDAEYGYTLELD